jgi:hypothetical protein
VFSSWIINAFFKERINEIELFFQQSRMEERLDDAIYVLRNHAEGQFPREFHAQMGAPVGVPGYPAGSVPSSLTGNASSVVDSVVSAQCWMWLCFHEVHLGLEEFHDI